jgi:CDP-diacylglycerol--serine O-phosphatidyltransferase
MIIAHHQTQIPFLTKAATLIVTVPVLSLLMVSTIRYRSFKHVKWDKKMRIFALSMLLLAVAAGTLTKPVFALVLLLLVYLISGPVEYIALMLFRAYHRIHPPESLQEATKIPGK